MESNIVQTSLSVLINVFSSEIEVKTIFVYDRNKLIKYPKINFNY